MLRGFVMVVGCVAPAWAQLVTTDAGVISPELPTVKERLEWLPRDDADELRAITRLAWAPERRLQLDLGVPLVSRRVAVPVGAGVLRGTQDGFGDLAVAAKWALLRDDDVMRSNRVSVLADLLLPTGERDPRIDGVDLGPRAGIGLGTVGGALGLGYTLVRDRHRAAVAVRGFAFASDDGFAPGEALTVDVAWWFRLLPDHFTAAGTEAEVRGVVELLGRWQADDRWRGVDLGNGGHDFSCVVGLQCNLDPATSVEAGVVLPLDATTDSPFGDARVGFLFTFRMSF